MNRPLTATETMDLRLRDMERVKKADADKARVGEWFSKHPKASQFMGRVATGFLEAFDRKQMSEMLNDTAVQLRAQAQIPAEFDIANQNFNAAHNMPDNLAVLPTPVIPDQTLAIAAEKQQVQPDNNVAA